MAASQSQTYFGKKLIQCELLLFEIDETISNTSGSDDAVQMKT